MSGTADGKGSAVAASGKSDGKTDGKLADGKGSASTATNGKATPPDGKGSAAVATNSKTDGKATPVVDGKGSGAAKLAPVTGGPPRPSEHRGPVKPPADLAAIKLDMEPNWDRDYDQAGTISFVLNVPSTGDKRVFAFTYGYDVDRAPADREAYKKFLADQRLLNVTLDRQRGAAWYLEGTDGNGNPAFRYLVTFGGKRLVCGGSLFKDKDSTALGPDLRDKVVAAAKKICETLSL